MFGVRGEAYAAPPNGTFFFLRTCARVGGGVGQTGAAGGARGLLPSLLASLWMAVAENVTAKMGNNAKSVKMVELHGNEGFLFKMMLF